MTGADPDGLRYLRPVADALAPLIAEAPGSLGPCTTDEVAALQALVAPHQLPAAYVEFLRLGGQQLAGVFGGVDFSYGLARRTRENGNRGILRMLRVVDKAAMIPDTLFVINEHLAANFTYFDLGDGDDPPVYLWEDGDQVYGSSWTTASWPRVARCAFPTGSDVFGRPRRSRHKATPCPSTRT